MTLGVFPSVPLEDRVYVGVDDAGTFTYVRYRGGTEIAITEEEAKSDQWHFFYSTDALERIRSMFRSNPKETRQG